MPSKIITYVKFFGKWEIGKKHIMILQLSKELCPIIFHLNVIKCSIIWLLLPITETIEATALTLIKFLHNITL